VAKLATTSASSAAVNQHALQRALNSGGGSLNGGRGGAEPVLTWA
jgi:hypothetical protein